MNGIVVGVDGSPGADSALRFAEEEARLRGAELHVVCAWAVPTMAYAGGAIDGLPESLRQGAHDVLHDLPGEHHVIEGHPSRVLLEAAEGADLLVVGSRGLGGLGRVLLGSVGSEVVHHAPCPVVIVPPADQD